MTYAPLQRINEISTASLEKILVDLFSDKEFISFQGNEIYKIFQNAFETYTINESTMLRYTDRKKKKDKINALLQTIKWQQIENSVKNLNLWFPKKALQKSGLSRLQNPKKQIKY